MSKPDAYLVVLPPNTVPNVSVFLDSNRAIEYAAQHHGIVKPPLCGRKSPPKG